MDIETKLDEDFLFYMEFTDTFFQKTTDPDILAHGEAWMQKLCNVQFKGPEEKRDRNIYIANLVCAMQSGCMCGPFDNNPPEKLEKALEVFGAPTKELVEPKWMEEIVEAGGDDFREASRDARTYLATKTLPNQEGAFGYVAVSLDDGQQQWFEKQGLDKFMEEKFQQYNPPLTEIEKILIMRSNPVERGRIITFYDVLLDAIKNEIEGTVPLGTNDAIKELLAQLTDDLQKRDRFQKYEGMREEDRYMELLYILDDRIRARRDRVSRNELLLDDIEERVKPEDFWDTSLQPEDIYKENKQAYAMQMWEEAISKGPRKKQMDLLEETYPESLIDKFLKLLQVEKEKIAIRCQRKHENIVSQLKKELRKEGERGRKKISDIQAKGEEIIEVVELVRAAEQKAYETHVKRDDMLKGTRKDRDEMYQQTTEALLETHMSAEEEAERGRLLTQQIKDVSMQNESYREVNEESVRKIEDQNIALMRNINRLTNAVKGHTKRLEQIREMPRVERTTDSDRGFFV